MHLRLLIRFGLLAIGFALTTFGVLGWHHVGFDVAISNTQNTPFAFHPIYALILGLALIPPSLWEIFVLETRTEDVITGPAPAGVSQEQQPQHSYASTETTRVALTGADTTSTGNEANSKQRVSE